MDHGFETSQLSAAIGSIILSDISSQAGIMRGLFALASSYTLQKATKNARGIILRVRLNFAI